MKLKVFKLTFLFISATLFSQNSVNVVVTLDEKFESDIEVKIYEKTSGFITRVKVNEPFELIFEATSVELIFVAEGYPSINRVIDLSKKEQSVIKIKLRAEELSEVVLSAKRREVFLLKRMEDFQQTEIYAGKKNEVILIEQSMGNLASNNSRQIFNQIPGLNIYQNDDAGLQLNIGGRGLDPNRTSNFNTRQNGYDISADVLGYPESYYTPPAEGLEEIQIIILRYI